MKKFLLFSIFLLNLLPNMNIRTGSISIGWSTLSAQQMGNEIAYYCHDDEIGWYNSPIPCDEEVCHQACIIGDCPWEGDCDAYDFHVQVDHSDTDDQQDNNNQDNSNDSSNNGGGGGSGGSSGSGSGNGGNGNTNNQYYTSRTNDVLLKKNMKIQWNKQQKKYDCFPTAMGYAAELTGNWESTAAASWFKQIYYNLYNVFLDDYGVLPSNIDNYLKQIFEYDIIEGGESIRKAINSQCPVLATIKKGNMPHEVLIVGYNIVISNTVVYICIDPGTGQYEDHTYSDFMTGNYHKYIITGLNNKYKARQR